MSQTLFIALLVGVVIFVFLYRRKKKVENKMGDELNALIESDDWQGVCRILRKQLVIWGCVLVLVVGLIVARFTMGGAYFLCTYNCCCVYSLEIL